LNAADITIGNLESSLGDMGEPVAKSYNFQAPPEAAQSLALAGFDIVSLANNHAMDYGPQALLQAVEILESNEIQTLGAGANLTDARKPVIVEKNGIRVAFLGYVDVPVEVTGFDTRSWEAGLESPGIAWASPETIIQDVSAAKASADVVVVILHSGYEFLQQPSPAQIAASQAAIDAGASLVIGHHSHLLQGVSFYGDGVIVYGLSNFAFDMEGSSDSAILNIWLDSGGVRNLELVPVVIGQGGQPEFPQQGESRRIREEVYFLSELLSQP
jgi:poly-gamma-glutamate capsule biosynthesis protein CapA/YwtB (metallophosphatase superfamily)